MEQPDATFRHHPTSTEADGTSHHRSAWVVGFAILVFCVPIVLWAAWAVAHTPVEGTGPDAEDVGGLPFLLAAPALVATAVACTTLPGRWASAAVTLAVALALAGMAFVGATRTALAGAEPGPRVWGAPATYDCGSVLHPGSLGADCEYWRQDQGDSVDLLLFGAGAFALLALVRMGVDWSTARTARQRALSALPPPPDRPRPDDAPKALT